MIDGIRVHVSTLSDELVSLEARADKPIARDWMRLLRDSFEFIIARNTYIIVETWVHGVHDLHRLRSGPFRHRRCVLHDPVHHGNVTRAPDFWALFEKFLFYLYSNPNIATPLLNELHSIRNSAEGSFQTASLTLAVAVESLAKLLLQKSVVDNSDAVANLQEHVQKWAGDESLRKRAIGMLGDLKRPTARLLLTAWTQSKGIDETLVSSWRRLRNKTAHGGQLEGKQEEYDWYMSSLELLYRMIADAVNYSGHIEQTSKHGQWGQLG